MKEITPIEFSCGIGACPAVFEHEDSYIIIGKLRVIEDLKNRVGEDEVIVEVPRGLLNRIGV